jgi:hypothetical protein
MDKKKTLKQMREEIKQMIEASQKRQGRDTKSEMGSKAMKAKDTSKNFQDGGYKAKTKVDGSKYQGAPISKANLQEYKEAQSPKERAKPRQRRGAGREDMISNQRQREIMEREERKRKNNMDKGGSNVVGS